MALGAMTSAQEARMGMLHLRTLARPRRQSNHGCWHRTTAGPDAATITQSHLHTGDGVENALLFFSTQWLRSHATVPSSFRLCDRCWCNDLVHFDDGRPVAVARVTDLLPSLGGLFHEMPGRSAPTEAGTAHLKGLTQLQLLGLSGCSELTDVGIAHLKGLTQMRSLDLMDCTAQASLT